MGVHFRGKSWYIDSRFKGVWIGLTFALAGSISVGNGVGNEQIATKSALRDTISNPRYGDEKRGLKDRGTSGTAFNRFLPYKNQESRGLFSLSIETVGQPWIHLL